MNIAVVTAIFGNYDIIRPGGYFASDVPYILFTDNPDMSFEGWTTKVVTEFDHLSHVRQARAVKILVHQMLPNVEYTVWHGSNVVLLRDPVEAVHQWLDGHQLAAFDHPHRDCVYEEAKVCKMMGKGKPSEIDDQMASYQAEGYPRQHGLAAAWFLLRHHGTWVDEFSDRWWTEVQEYSSRDQLSFNYMLWKMDKSYKTIPGDLLNHSHFRYHMGHRSWEG